MTNPPFRLVTCFEQRPKNYFSSKLTTWPWNARFTISLTHAYKLHVITIVHASHKHNLFNVHPIKSPLNDRLFRLTELCGLRHFFLLSQRRCFHIFRLWKTSLPYRNLVFDWRQLAMCKANFHKHFNQNSTGSKNHKNAKCTSNTTYNICGFVKSHLRLELTVSVRSQ